MRRFQMVRNTDVTGYSGTGLVAEGVEFDDGAAVIRWCSPGKPASTVVWGSFADAVEVHGHDGATEFIWLDHASRATTDPRERAAT